VISDQWLWISVWKLCNHTHSSILFVSSSHIHLILTSMNTDRVWLMEFVQSILESWFVYDKHKLLNDLLV